MSDTPSLFDGIDTNNDSLLIHPDVIRTIIGEGDPALIASVLANRRSKSGRDYNTLIQDTSQFKARTGDAWDRNSKIAEDDPQYQKALAVAGPILLGQQKPITDADTFYAPELQAQNKEPKPSFDDGTGVKGPDGQLYFKGKYSAPSTPSMFDGAPPPPVDDTPQALAVDSATDSARNAPNASWPVYDPYNKVGRNQDGSIAYVGPPTPPVTFDETGHPVVTVTGGSNPEVIKEWLSAHPQDIANGPKITQPVAAQDTGTQALTGLGQGLANVKNSIEGLGAGLGQGWKNDLTRNLLNRQSNDVTYANSVPYGLGKFGGELAATAPIMAVPGAGELAEGALAGSRFAPAAQFVGGNFGTGLVRGASLGVKGALQGGEAAALTSAGSNQSLEDQVKQGLLLGGVAAPVLHGAGSLITNHFLPTVSQPIADLASTAKSKFGIDLKNTQILSGEHNVSDRLAPDAVQQSQRMKAIAGTFGENTDTLTRPVLQAAQQRIGGDINAIAARNTIYNTADLQSNLNDVIKEARASGLTADQMKPLLAQVTNINSKIGASGLPGTAYSTLIGRKGALDLAANNADSSIAHFAQKIRKTLDNSFDAEATGIDPKTGLTDAAAMDKARSQYKAWATVKGVVDPRGKIPIDGSLDRAVSKSYGNRDVYGAGPLGDLADIDTQFFKTPSTQKGNWGSSAFDLLSGGLTGGAALQALQAHDPLLAGKIIAGGAAATAAKHYLGAPISEGIINNNPFLRPRLLQGPQAAIPNSLINYTTNKFSTPAAVMGAQTLAPHIPMQKRQGTK